VKAAASMAVGAAAAPLGPGEALVANGVGGFLADHLISQISDTGIAQMLKDKDTLGRDADIAIEVYAMDSILGRTLVTDDRVELRDALCRYFCMESRERVFQRARTALCAVVPSEEVEAQLEQLGSLHRYTPVNSAEVREGIVPAVLDSGGYPLAYA